MRVIHQEIIGFQDIYEPDRIVRQTRSFCMVEPYGPFIADPDGDITELLFIDPQEYASYVIWGTIGDHIIKRAVDLYAAYNTAKANTHRV